MKIKKKDLRKGEAQLPINYPAPELDETFTFSLDAEKSRVENLCKRLAHNEVAVREAVLSELPRYLREATQYAEAAENRIDEAGLRRFIAMQLQKEQEKHQHSKIGKTNAVVTAQQKKNGKKENKKETVEKDDDGKVVTINLLRELDAFRSRTTNAQREQLRQLALRRMHETQNVSNARGVESNRCNYENDDEKDNSALMKTTAQNMSPSTPGTAGSLRQMYRAWVAAWAETELLLLKLARGLFFCLWHTDKPLVQLDCAHRIAQLLNQPRTVSGKVLFFSCMMRVLAKEWRTMDRYRADKFLALVRRLVNELLCLLNSLEAATRSAASDKKKNKEKYINNNNNSNCNHGNNEDVTNCEPLRRALEEVSYVIQQQIVPEPAAVGLSMHTCDVLFDELCRAAVSPPLFVAVADRVALFAMSRGNYVEKRVLDFFIAPIAGGLLAARRQEMSDKHQEQNAKKKQDPRKLHKEEKSVDSTTLKAAGCKRAQRGINEDVDNEAKVKTDAETQFILLALADRCRAYAVAQRTVRPVRVMFTESEMILRQAANPAAYETLSRSAQRRRIEREVSDVDETRKAVAAERHHVRLLRTQDNKKLRKTTSSENDTDEEQVATRKQQAERKSKIAPRNTKRKKHYTLTKKDLYEDGDE